MFLKNAWYVAARVEEVGRALTARTILGAAIALFRRDDGRPAALADACAHKKLPLSMGRLTGDRVECGYHGMVFDGDGRCVHIPSQSSIPNRASVRSYPLAEKWGFVWIWMGEASAADESEIVPIDNFDAPAWGRTKSGAMVLETSYLNITDNLLDPSHVAFVHRSSFAAYGCEDTPLDVKVEKSGVTVSRWIFDRQPPAYYAKLVRFDGRCDRLQHYEVRVPSVAINKSIFTPAGTGGRDEPLHPDAYVMVSYNFLTPIDGERTHYYWFQHRNTDPRDESVSRTIVEGTEAAFAEDRLVLEGVQRGQRSSDTKGIVLSIDHGSIRFRQLLAERIAREQNR